MIEVLTSSGTAMTRNQVAFLTAGERDSIEAGSLGR